MNDAILSYLTLIYYIYSSNFKKKTLIPQVLSSDLANKTNWTKCREVFEDNLLCYVSSGSTLCSVMSLALYYLRLYITTAENFAVFVASPMQLSLFPRYCNFLCPCGAD